MIWIIFAMLCVASAATYRLGGTSAGTKWRDLGTSACLIASLPVLCLVHGPWAWLALIPAYGMTMAALTTYRYFLPKPQNYTCWYYGLHGFMVALADLPFAWASGRWVMFGLRCAVCAVLVGLWSGLGSQDDLEEGGRGFILNVSRLIYLL